MTRGLSPELSGLLATWLPRQRWYGGKGRAVAGVEVLRSHALVQHDDVEVSLVLLRVSTEDGGA